MDHELMRLKCLEMAMAQGLKGDEARAEAERMMQFARECSLLDKAYGIKPGASVPKARAVGRDGEFEKPFRDYIARDDN